VSSLRARNPRSPLAWWLFAALWLVVLADVSGDYAVFAGSGVAGDAFKQLTQLVSTVLIGLLALLGSWALARGKCAFRAAPETKLFLVFLGASTAFGVLVGLGSGVQINYVIGDSQNIVTYLILFAIGGGVSRSRIEALRRLFLIGCGILVLKLAYSYWVYWAVYGGLSWRSMLKLSSFFGPMMFVTLAWVLYGKRAAIRRRYAILALPAAYGIFAAQARGLFMGALAGALFFGAMSLNHRRLYRVLLLGLVIMSIGLGAGAALQGDITKSFGYWEESDPTFVGGLDYRSRQAAALLTRFGNNWLTGVGLGSYDPNYEGYADWLPRPYLAELEYLNLLAKLGVIGFSLWIAAFFSLLVACIRAVRQTVDPEHRGLVTGLTAGLVALMVASSVQTLYSSVNFHLYVVLVLLVLSALRAPQLQSRQAGRISGGHAPTM